MEVRSNTTDQMFREKDVLSRHRDADAGAMRPAGNPRGEEEDEDFVDEDDLTADDDEVEEAAVAADDDSVADPDDADLDAEDLEDDIDLDADDEEEDDEL